MTTPPPESQFHTLSRLFSRLASRKIYGGADCVRLLFDDPDNDGGTEVTVYINGPRRGAVTLWTLEQETIDNAYRNDVIEPLEKCELGLHDVAFDGIYKDGRYSHCCICYPDGPDEEPSFEAFEAMEAFECH